jgi:hypothetical protein
MTRWRWDCTFLLLLVSTHTLLLFLMFTHVMIYTVLNACFTQMARVCSQYLVFLAS